jgi:maltose alpha-D-glucosyltransferase/alpha-amylase
MPGTPVIRYGEEIGMGDNLSLPEREAIRTPMQWDDTPNAGFSSTDPRRLVAPVVDFGPYHYQRVNVTSQRLDAHSLLTWFERILHALRECAEIGSGDHTVIDAGPPHVLVHRADASSGSTLFAHNLADQPCTLECGSQKTCEQRPLNFFADSDYGSDVNLEALELAPFGYRWIRLRHEPGR